MEKYNIFVKLLVVILIGVAVYMFINNQQENKMGEDNPLISRDILFENPDKTNPNISSDGKP